MPSHSYPDLDTVRGRIDAARQERKKTWQELSDELGLGHHSAISRSKKRYDLDELLRMSVALAVPAAWLAWRIGEGPTFDEGPHPEDGGSSESLHPVVEKLVEIVDKRLLSPVGATSTDREVAKTAIAKLVDFVAKPVNGEKPE